MSSSTSPPLILFWDEIRVLPSLTGHSRLAATGMNRRRKHKNGSSSKSVLFEAGDIITSAEPFVHVLDMEWKGSKCDNCYNSNPGLKRCSGCDVFHYCSRECQVQDWSSAHKHECKFHRKAKQTRHKIDVHYLSLVLLRLYFMVRAKPDLMQIEFDLFNGKKRSLSDLMDDEANGMHDQHLENIIKKFSSIDPDMHLDKSLMKSLFHKLRINSFAIKSQDEMREGSALFIQSSIFDHSCSSNAAYIFNGKRMEVRAMKDIADGEEVTIQYVDALLPKSERQAILFETWFFLCQCERCSEGETDEEREELALNKEYHDSLSSEQMNKLSHEEQSDRIFKALQTVLPIKEKYYSSFHPNLTMTMHVAVCSMTERFKTLDPKDKKFFKQLMQKLELAIPVTHGKDHQIWSLFSLLKSTIRL